MVIGVSLEQITARSCFQEILNERLAVVHRENEDFGLGQPGTDLAGRLDAVNQRQRVVEHSNIRLSLDRLADGVFAVCDVGNDLPVGLRFKHPTQSRTNHLMVIGNKDTRHATSPCLSPHAVPLVGSSAKYCIREYLENQKEVTAAPGHEVAGSFTDRRQISWVFQFRWHIVGGSQAYP